MISSPAGSFFLAGELTEAQRVVAEALIKVAMATGCRRNELLTAEPKQINGTRLHLWETKTDTPRTIPMSEQTSPQSPRVREVPLLGPLGSDKRS
ncbi:hypothetical protein A8V01_09165 [Novosphingobium guangzhouense]|uniref:Tyr recombinase domain-containing protein n=1 Tax=Novosphingobium guangzhouense TaxID=1850347 RepID=A0A2K2FUR5_9SPHN|nr:hypothetical protein A8V01_09165 [Novosphingobium guangzhouense]